MADDWIGMRHNLRRCPEVIQLAAALPDLSLENTPHVVSKTSAKSGRNVRTLSTHELKVSAIIGGLHATWSLADEQTTDGRLEGYTPEILDTMVGIPNWSANLQHVGWLVVEEQAIVVPNFSEWFDEGAKKRAKDAKRKRAARKEPPHVVSKTSESSGQNSDQRRGEERRDKEPPFPRDDAGGNSDGNATEGMANQLARSVLVEQVCNRVTEIRPKTKLGPRERKQINDRLCDGYSVEDLALALSRGMGRKPALGVRQVLRSGDSVGSLLEAQDGPERARAAKDPTVEFHKARSRLIRQGIVTVDTPDDEVRAILEKGEP